MKKQLLTVVIKQAWCYFLSYFTRYLFPIIKDTFNQTKDQFLETLWDKIKEEISSHAEAAVRYVEYFFESATYQEKEKEVIDTIFRNAKFPIALRPFKPLIKKVLRSKVHNLIAKYLKKLNSKF